MAARVSRHGGADVAPLHVQQGQGSGLAQAGERTLEHCDTGGAKAREEGRLWLDDGYRPGERLHAGHRKRLQTLNRLVQTPVRQQSRVRIDPGTQRAVLIHGDPQPCPEGVDHRLFSHLVCAIPTASVNRANPLSCKAAASSRLTRSAAVGSLNVAVPTWIALAPAGTSSTRSPRVGPPRPPMTGTAGTRPSIIAACTC